MVAALCLSVAVFLAVPPSSQTRCRRIFHQGSGTKKAFPPPTVLAMALSALACVTFFGIPTGFLIALVAAPVSARFVGHLESGEVRRRRGMIGRQLPGAIDLLIAVLDAGRPTADAFTLVARATAEPLSAELAVIAGRLSVAGDEQAVWEGLCTKPEFAALGRSFRRAGRSGMPVGRILGRLADELRRERRATSQERARSVATTTAAPLGLCFLPAFFLIGIVPTIVGAFSALHF